MKTSIVQLILSLCACLLFIGCKGKQTQLCTSDTAAAPNGFLIMGTSSDYPPYEFLQNDGNLVGLDIDIANALAAHLGKQLVIQEMDFNGLIPALNAKRIDVIFAGLTITPERAAKLDFTVAYFCPTAASLAILYRTDTPMHTFEDLANKRVGVQLGSAMEQVLIAQQASLPGTQVLSLGRNNQLVEELKIGRIDAVLLDAPQANAFTRNNASLAFSLVKSPNTPGLHAAVAKGSTLLPELNSAIDALIAAGQLTTLAHKWFNPQGDSKTQSEPSLVP